MSTPASPADHRLRILSCAVMLAVGTLAACNDSDGPSAPAPAPAPAPPPPPGATACAGLPDVVSASSVFPANTVVTSATFVAATAALPEHCDVLGTLNAGRAGADSSPGVKQTYAIKWSISLPTQWNGRLVHEGGGGLDGTVPSTSGALIPGVVGGRLASGYAVAADDSGHDNAVNSDPKANGAAAFGTDDQARVDFAYNAIDLTNQVSRQMLLTYYGSLAQYSYFEGCSMGGREAMMVSQKLPTRFDGVVSGDPGFKLTAMSTHEIYGAQQLGALATSMGLATANGVPLIANTFTDGDLQLVSKAVLDACDAKDGLVDGMVNAPLQCTTAVVTPFLNALQCSGAKTSACLASGQIDAIQKIYAGPVTPSGQATYYPWMWDAGIAGCTSAADCNAPGATNIAGGWRQWKIGTFQPDVSTATNNALDWSTIAGGGLSTMLAPTPPHPPASTSGDDQLKVMLGYDLDAYYASIFATSTTFPTSSHELLDVDSSDLSPFNSHGAKLIVWQPQSGGPFSPLAMVDWYQKLNAANGGTPFDYSNVQKFARLFMMPGAQHCGSGPSTSQIDPFNAVVDWVEHGTAPAKIVGTAAATTPWPGRTRPLCPFPQIATYKGSGSVDVESSFTCQ